MIDYKGIINGLEPEKVKELLIQLGAEQVVEHSTYLQTNTICHNIDDGGLNLCFYYDTKIFMCYSECGGQSIFTFLKHYYETRQIEYDWYQDIFEVARNCSKNKEKNNFETANLPKIRDRYIKRKEVFFEPIPKGILGVFTKLYPTEWLYDGISKKAMDKFNILFSISQNKIIIPHYDIYENLIGIRGRALDEWEIENIGKYAPVQLEGKWYTHKLSLNLYGLNQNVENIKRRKIVYLAESEKAVLQAESFSEPNCTVAVCGSNFNKYQLNLLLRHCQPDEVIICFDKEESPKENKYFNKLMKLGKKYSNYCSFSFVYDIDGLLEMKDSPFDRGEEIFKKLVERRVKIK